MAAISATSLSQPIQTQQVDRCIKSPGKGALIGLGIILMIGGAVAAGLLYSHLGYTSLTCLASIPAGIALIVVGIVRDTARQERIKLAREAQKEASEELKKLEVESATNRGALIGFSMMAEENCKNLVEAAEEAHKKYPQGLTKEVLENFKKMAKEGFAKMDEVRDAAAGLLENKITKISATRRLLQSLTDQIDRCLNESPCKTILITLGISFLIIGGASGLLYHLDISCLVAISVGIALIIAGIIETEEERQERINKLAKEAQKKEARKELTNLKEEIAKNREALATLMRRAKENIKQLVEAAEEAQKKYPQYLSQEVLENFKKLTNEWYAKIDEVSVAAEGLFHEETPLSKV
jgi:predicted lipid-binding transport protein (Tim44 family)